MNSHNRRFPSNRPSVAIMSPHSSSSYLSQPSNWFQSFPTLAQNDIDQYEDLNSLEIAEFNNPNITYEDPFVSNSQRYDNNSFNTRYLNDDQFYNNQNNDNQPAYYNAYNDYNNANSQYPQSQEDSYINENQYLDHSFQNFENDNDNFAGSNMNYQQNNLSQYQNQRQQQGGQNHQLDDHYQSMRNSNNNDNRQYDNPPASHNPNHNYGNHRDNEPNNELFPVSNLPDSLKQLFPFRHFNAVQSECIQLVYYSDVNLIVSSPTGSGKTAIFELAIARLLTLPGGSSRSFKVIYIAPTKSLCSERAQDWKSKFRTLGITCGELTGDVNYVNQSDIQKSNIIVTTPEKWDSTTRRWRDYKNLMNLISLFLIDEVHMLDDVRGATLEVVVSRMKNANLEISRSGKGENGIRMLAISATVPNIEDISLWLRNVDESPAVVKVFGESYRPVPIQREVLGIAKSTKGAFQADKNLDFKLMEIVSKYNERKPSLIFCTTRKSTQQSAEQLAKDVAAQSTANYGQTHPFVYTKPQFDFLKHLQKNVKDVKLAEIVSKGIAFHNAGLTIEDRKLVENGFLKGMLMVICTTSTLAVGVNLPAHLVVIKGTNIWSRDSGAMVEISELEILQMIGRAGRPQFDTSAVAVILTSPEKKAKYENLIKGGQIIESSLHENLIEHLNAEIVLGSITNSGLAIEWLKSSFLYIRLQKNPERYKVKRGHNNVAVKSFGLEEICKKDLELLETCGLMVKTGSSYSSTPFGNTCAKFYLKFQTCVNFVRIVDRATCKDILEVICKSEEFENVRFRQDKTQLNSMAKSNDLKFPVLVKGKPIAVHDKVNLLIQYTLGSIPFPEKTAFAMNQDVTSIFFAASRVIQAMLDILHEKKDGVSLRNGIIVAQAITAKCWASSYACLQQIEGIGPAIAKVLRDNQICTIQKLLLTDERRIELIVGRHAPFGNNVKNSILKWPKFKLQVSQVTDLQRKTITLSVTISLQNSDTVVISSARGPSNALFIANCGGHLFDFRKIPLHQLKTSEVFSFLVKAYNPNQKVSCSVFCENHVGVDVHMDLILTSEIISKGDLPPAYSKSDSSNDAVDWNDGVNWDDIDWDSFDQRHDVSPTALKSKRDSLTTKAISTKSELSVSKKPTTTLETVPCTHKCKNKETCKHSCCKNGVLSRKKRSYAINTIPDSGSDSDSDSSLIMAFEKNKKHKVVDLTMSLPPDRMNYSIMKSPTVINSKRYPAAVSNISKLGNHDYNNNDKSIQIENCYDEGSENEESYDFASLQKKPIVNLISKKAAHIALDSDSDLDPLLQGIWNKKMNSNRSVKVKKSPVSVLNKLHQNIKKPNVPTLQHNSQKIDIRPLKTLDSRLPPFSSVLNAVDHKEIENGVDGFNDFEIGDEFSAIGQLSRVAKSILNKSNQVNSTRVFQPSFQPDRWNENAVASSIGGIAGMDVGGNEVAQESAEKPIQEPAVLSDMMRDMRSWLSQCNTMDGL